MLSKLYRLMWHPTTHRPWTYALRQTGGLKVALGILGALPALLALCAWLTAILSGFWLGVTMLTIGLTGGYLLGHLFWDTRGNYIKHRSFYEKGGKSKW